MLKNTRSRTPLRSRRGAIQRAKSKAQSRVGMTSGGNSTSQRRRSAPLRRSTSRRKHFALLVKAFSELPGWQLVTHCGGSRRNWVLTGSSSPDIVYTESGFVQINYDAVECWGMNLNFRGPVRSENSRVWWNDMYMLSFRSGQPYWRDTYIPNTVPQYVVRLITAVIDDSEERLALRREVEEERRAFAEYDAAVARTIASKPRSSIMGKRPPRVPKTYLPRKWRQTSARRISRWSYDLLWNATVMLSSLGLAGYGTSGARSIADMSILDRIVAGGMKLVLGRAFARAALTSPAPGESWAGMVRGLWEAYDRSLEHPYDGTRSANLARAIGRFPEYTRPGYSPPVAGYVNIASMMPYGRMRYSATVMRRAFVKEVVDSDLVPTMRAQ